MKEKTEPNPDVDVEVEVEGMQKKDAEEEIDDGGNDEVIQDIEIDGIVWSLLKEDGLIVDKIILINQDF